MKASKHLIFTSLVIALIVSGCKKKKDDNTDTDPGTITYDVPTTYNFSNVSYTDQTSRIAMFTEIDAETGKGTTANVSATKLKDMFANANSQFAASALNTSGLQIKNHTLSTATADAEKFMDSVAKASLSYSTTYSNGIAGVAINGTSKYLLNAYGVEYKQLISKFLMGTFLLNEIKNNYLSSSLSSLDNETVVTGQGTAMEHAWDQAFGCFGVKIQFPDTLTGLKYLGNYCNQVDPISGTGTGSKKKIMNAFLKGRAAISNKDYTTRDEQKAIVLAELEKLLAAGAIHELNASKTNFANLSRLHTLSESKGFILTLKAVGSTITPSQADALLAIYPTNFNDFTVDNINDIINTLSTVYGLDAVKGSL